MLCSIRNHGVHKIKDEMLKFYSREMEKIVEHKNNLIKIHYNYTNQLEHTIENTQETTRIAMDVINQRNEEINNIRPNVP